MNKLSTTANINYFLNRRAINIDLSFRCPLQCPKCQRQNRYLDYGKKVPGRDLTLNEIDKISNFYNFFSFCGQYSDPVHHPKFPQILKMLYNKKVACEVHNAASQKSKEYFINCFKANPSAQWIFAIDGLPEESHKYRINQDGKKLFDIMCESKKHLLKKPIWQYIIFRYNENHIEQAKQISKDIDVNFLLIQSSRWDKHDPYKPTNKELRLNDH
jgi:MoaA/NifB/PqqE/SkfB family radical SAM enzyme